MANIHVVLSGGVGSSLWALLPKSGPKQYLPLLEGKNAFQLCVERNLFWSEQQIVVGNKNNQEVTRKSMDALGLKDYVNIIESAPRNTAAAIAFAAFSRNENDILMITPADQLINGKVAYSQAIERALHLATEGFLVTFGVPPARAETGFGYMECDGEDVLRFKEKPDRATAEKFVSNNAFLWNTGMFCFKAGVFLSELALYQPELFEAVSNAWTTRQGNVLMEKETMQIPALSVDYAVMEHSGKLKVIKAEFEWNDVNRNSENILFRDEAIAV